MEIKKLPQIEAVSILWFGGITSYDAIKFFNLSNSRLLFVKNKLLNTELTAFANEENVTLGVWFFFIKIGFWFICFSDTKIFWVLFLI